MAREQPINERIKHFKPWHRAVVLAVPLLLLAVAWPGSDTASAQGRQRTRPSPTRGRIVGNDFIFGVNLPWFDKCYGHHLGPNFMHPDWGFWYNRQKVSDYLDDIDKIGFRVVRVFLMEQAQGWVLDDNGIVTGLDDAFLKNLDDLVQQAGDKELKLYLCMTTWWLGMKCPSPVKDERQQKAYIERVVKPLAKRFKGDQTVFAFDVFGEIESELSDQSKDNKVTVAQAQAFIRRNIQAIKSQDPRRLITAASGWGDWNNVKKGYYRNLGLDFYAIDVYRDDGFLPDVRELNTDRPVIVSECGQSTKREDDEIQRKCVTNFLRNAMSKGYAGCLVWEYSPKGEYMRILRDNGEYKPVVADIREIIKSGSPKKAVSEKRSSIEFEPVVSFTGDLSDSSVEDSKDAKIVDSKIGKAAQFDGRGYIKLKGDCPAGSSPRTMAAWIKNTRGPVDELIHVLSYGPIEQARVFGIIEANRCWRFYDWGGGLDSGVKVDTDWHHHCICYDGKKITYYFDGKAVGEVKRQLATGGAPVMLGAHYELGDQPEKRAFVGLIGEFFIYDRALTAEQVTLLMTNGYKK